MIVPWLSFLSIGSVLKTLNSRRKECLTLREWDSAHRMDDKVVVIVKIVIIDTIAPQADGVETW